MESFVFIILEVGIDSVIEHGLSTYEAYLIVAIIALFGSLATLAVYIKNVHDKHNKEIMDIGERHYNEQKDMTEKVTSAMINQTHALENNTKVADKIYQHLLTMK